MLDLDASDKIILYALIWACLIIFSLAKLSNYRYKTVGLPLAFLLTFMFAHAGALIHLIDGYNPALSPYLRTFNYDRETVALGLEASCIGMVGAFLGFYLTDKLAPSPKSFKRQISTIELRRASLFIIFVGVASVLFASIFSRFVVDFGGIQAALGAMRNFFVVGACGYVYSLYISGKKQQAAITAGALSLVIPIFLLLTTAILADSVAVAIEIVCFYLAAKLSYEKTFLRNLAVVSISICLAFVFASAYLQSRVILRRVVWAGEGVTAAAEAVVSLSQSFDLSDVTEFNTLAQLDSRLNQNIFVGLAIQHLASGSGKYENGATIAVAMLGWVPRFVWPGKPERGGSAFLTKHTGLQFAQGTTIGAGPVFEFYVNYGYFGVFLGFIVFGLILRLLDRGAAIALSSGELGRFAQYQLSGAALMAPLNDLIFFVAAVGASLLVGLAGRITWSRLRR